MVINLKESFEKGCESTLTIDGKNISNINIFKLKELLIEALHKVEIQNNDRYILETLAESLAYSLGEQNIDNYVQHRNEYSYTLNI